MTMMKQPTITLNPKPPTEPLTDAQRAVISEHLHAQGVVERLPSCVGLPEFVVAPHDSRGDGAWIPLACEVCLDLTTIEGMDDDALGQAFARILTERMAVDLGELIMLGDKSNKDDPFLATLDGLRKLTEWPDELHMSERIDLTSDRDIAGCAVIAIATVHVRWQD